MAETKSKLNLKQYAADMSIHVLVIGRGPLTEDALKATGRAISMLADAGEVRELQYLKKHASPKIAQQASDALKQMPGPLPEYIETPSNPSPEEAIVEINRLCDKLNGKSA